MLSFDYDMMYLAISDTQRKQGGCPDTGYLNRKTGQIVFLPDSEGQAASWCGTDYAVDSVFDRAHIESSTDEWIKIPKNCPIPVHHEYWCDVRARRDLPRQQRSCTCGGAEAARQKMDDDEFIRAFLREHGLA
jgi:hypothetical protein